MQGSANERWTPRTGESEALKRLSAELYALANDPPQWRRHLEEGMKRITAPQLHIGGGVESVPAAAAARGLPSHLHETLRWALTGVSEKEIALEMGLSRHTVHEYMKRIYRRLGVRSRTELMALALDRQIRGGLPRREAAGAAHTAGSLAAT